MFNQIRHISIIVVGMSLMLFAQTPIKKGIIVEVCKGCEIVEVSLNGLINEIVKRNYTLYSEKIKVNQSEHKISLAEGIFEPKLKVGASYRRTNVRNSAEETVSRGFQDNYKDRVKDIQTSLSGLLFTGAEWNIGFTDRKKRSNLISDTQDYDSEYSDGFNISFKQPLLRGMGKDVTYAKINMAKIGTEISTTEYKNKLMGLIATTTRLYWKLYGTEKLYENWKETLRITEEQLSTLQSMVAHGKVPETELLEVKSSIFQKRTELLSLKATIHEIKNQFLSLLNISRSGFNSTLFIAKDRPILDGASSLFDIEKSYEKAIKNLPELKLAQLKLESEKLEQKYNENQLLPDLTLNSSVSTLGLANTRDNALYCSGGCNDQISWNVGLNLEIPLYGNQQAKENLAISKLNLKNSELAINSFHTEIYNLIATKIEQLQIEQSKFNEYKEEVRIKKQLLAIERQKLNLGRSRIKDILEYESKLMLAQRKLFSSIVNWKVAEALLNKATGELLAKQNIELDFDDKYQKNSAELNTALLER